ncbi:NF-kappa-B inhibitor-like protein 1 [Gouania willdenowi]|nr:NF-kappa-B inhibitor-like protein 1 [Gouania willdenowi]
MVSRQQRRVWRYVEEGSLTKLKSYLRKHRDLDVNFIRGRKQRSPLHLACSLEDVAILRLLLRHGADVLLTNHRGDTVLHTAVNKALKRGRIAYEDLVVPLKNSCPEALHIENRAGITPQDLLDWRKQSQSTETMSRPCKAETERDWEEKLFDECEDEFYETFGVYDDDDFLPHDEDEENYGDWAERIRHEYFNKKVSEVQRLSEALSRPIKKEKTRVEKEKEEQSNKDLHRQMQKEHEEYLARAARKQEETRQGKKRRYDEGCAATFNSSSSAGSAKLTYNDIPWPAPRGTVREMLDVMLHGVDRKDVEVFRKALRKQQALWHPDKFAQRCEARLEEKDKSRILDTVTALSQELNKLAQSVRK